MNRSHKEHPFTVSLQNLGDAVILLGKTFSHFPFVYRDKKQIIDQMDRIGVQSIPLVILVALFGGAVSAWLVAYQFGDLMSLRYLGAATSTAIILELGPVLAGLVIAGRIATSIAAEIGSMRVTEQIDALESLAIDPVNYLFFPRLVASMLAMPLLVILASATAIFGAASVGHYVFDVSYQTYFLNYHQFFSAKDIGIGLVKALVFGMLTSWIGAYIGFVTWGGARGVGQSATKAFVISAALIFLTDYIITSLLL